MTQTSSFTLLSQAWSTLTEHWQFTAVLSFISSLFAYLVGTENKELLLILMIMVLIETILGSMMAIKNKCFNSRGMGKGIVKVILYGCFLIMFHLAELVIDGSSGFEIHIIDLIAYLYLIIREAKGANEKLAVFAIVLPINPFMVIEKVMNRYAIQFEEAMVYEPKSDSSKQPTQNNGGRDALLRP